MPKFVLDASALLALLNDEPGASTVAELLEDAAISAVNLTEVATTLQDRGIPVTDVRRLIGDMKLAVILYDTDLAWHAAELRSGTKAAGLSLGDRACLATSTRLRAVAVTADAAWSRLNLDVKIRQLR